MKSWLIGFLVVILLILLGVRIYAYSHPLNTPPNNSPSPNPAFSPASSNTTAFCSPTVLQPQIETEPAAGNIWGKATITNNGTVTCQIVGSNFLGVSTNTLVKNITATPQGSPGPEMLTIAPGQTIYSQIHYPNGPQCSGIPKQTAVTFTYKISDTDSITFLALDGKNTFTVPSCLNTNEITDIQIWSLSDNPITQ